MSKASLVPVNSPLRQLRRLPKFANTSCRVLMVEDDYHLQRECQNALKQLGHEVVVLRVGTQAHLEPMPQIIDKVLKAIIAYQPDMLLSIDYLGFDHVNWMSEIIDAVALPTAIWCVDNPFFLTTGFCNPAPEQTSLFCWDRSFIAPLKSLGCRRVHHLPLATDRTLFAPSPSPAPHLYPLCFVGHSLKTVLEKWQPRIDAAQMQDAQALLPKLLENRHLLLDHIQSVQPTTDPNMVTLAFACFGAAQAYRQKILQTFAQQDLHIFGDPTWKSLLPQAHYHPSVPYGAPLARIFSQSQINLNVTNLQMPETVNQRVFDIPASGGLILTDPQAELENYFDIGREVLVYQTAEQALALAQRYQKDRQGAQAIIAAAQKRIIAEHTYTHRLEKIMATMRQEHRRGGQISARKPCPPASQKLAAQADTTL